MENVDTLIEFILRNDNLDFYIDLENKTIVPKDPDELNRELFFEVSELKKVIFTMFVNGQDLALNRILQKLVKSRSLLQGIDVGLSLNVEDHDFQAYIEPEDIQRIMAIKNSYLDELISLIKNFSFSTSEHTSQRLKTNLSVKELTYLFRALHDEKIVESRQKTDIFNFIADNFSSKQKDEISANSIKNAFDIPDYNAVDFWQEKFTHLMQKAKKDKEKYPSADVSFIDTRESISAFKSESSAIWKNIFAFEILFENPKAVLPVT